MAYLCAFLLAITANSVTQKLPYLTDRERDGLVGPVRQVVERRAGGETTTSYDPLGNLVEISQRYEVIQTREVYRRERYGEKFMRYYSLSSGGMSAPRLSPNPETEKDGAAVYRISYQYNPVYLRAGDPSSFDGMLYAGSAYSGRELAWRFSYRYDSRGRLISEDEIRSLDLLPSGKLYTYGPHDRAPLAVEQLENCQTRTKEWFTYDFDKQGNWIKRTLTKSDPAMPSAIFNVTERSISYY
jgi:hypothetical protein